MTQKKFPRLLELGGDECTQRRFVRPLTLSVAGFVKASQHSEPIPALEEALPAASTHAFDARQGDSRILDETALCRQQRRRGVDRGAQRRSPKLFTLRCVAHRPVVNVVLRKRSRVGEVQQAARSENQRVPMGVRLHIDAAGCRTRSELLPAHEPLRICRSQRGVHPISGRKQCRVCVEFLQDGKCGVVEVAPCVIEREQHAALRATRFSLPRRYELAETQRAVAIPAQEFKVAREMCRVDVVIDEYRQRPARQGEPQQEPGIVGTHCTQDTARGPAGPRGGRFSAGGIFGLCRHGAGAGHASSRPSQSRYRPEVGCRHSASVGTFPATATQSRT